MRQSSCRHLLNSHLTYNMKEYRGLLVLLISLSVWVCSGSAESTLLPQRDFIVTYPIRKLDILCNHGDELCDEDCFNPVTQICHDNQYGGQRACNISDTLCGWECLASDDSSRVCIDNQVCPAGQSLCSYQCYTPETHQCLNDDNVCLINEVACGYTCYNPENESKKCHKLTYNSYLCDANEEVCGAWGCYDPNVQTCDKEKERLCPIGATICGYGCANEADGEICLEDKQVCKQGQALCGYQCYTPTNEVCTAENLVCKTEEELCGTSTCYDPAAGQTCHNAESENYHMVCEPGLDYCYYDCYDQQKQDCIQPVADSAYKKVCPKGHRICNGRLTPYSGGYGCYDPSTQVCITNDQGRVLCNIGQETCGSSCYDTAQLAGNRCFEKSSVICKEDEEVCGKICYNNATKICFEDVVTNVQFGKK